MTIGEFIKFLDGIASEFVGKTQRGFSTVSGIGPRADAFFATIEETS